MKAKRFFSVVSVMTILALCGITLADPITIVATNGNVYSFGSETNLTGANMVSSHSYGEAIYSAASNPSNGNVVLGFDNGSAVIAPYNSLGTPISSGQVASSSYGGGNGILGTTVLPNGTIYFGSYNGWVYARSSTNVTAAPAGYGDPTYYNMQYNTTGYMYPTASPLNQVMIVRNDNGDIFLRQGNNQTLTVGAWDGMELGTSIYSQLTLSTGDVVFATTAGNPQTYLFVRSHADLSVAPTGYVDHAIMGTGVPIKALARTANDELLVGDNSGEVMLVNASNVGSTLEYATFPNSISALAVTSDGDAVIGLIDGRVYVRSLSNLAGPDIATGAFGSDIISLDVVPEPMTVTLLAVGGLLALRRRSRS